jgi:hypothetical protein
MDRKGVRKTIFTIFCLFLFISFVYAEFSGFTCVENREGVAGVIVSKRIHDYAKKEFWYIVAYTFGEEAGESEGNLKECSCSKVDFVNFSKEHIDFLTSLMKK